VTPSRLATLSHSADVVVAHSGVGSVLQQFALGNSPVLAVRRADRGEHVDNHQVELAATVAERGLATVLDLDRPSRSALEAAARRTVSTLGATADAVAAR
jgi:UDP-N-acetylglucosamine transferase subunit ALG13